MISVKDDARKIMSTLKNMLYSKKEFVCFDILCNSSPSIEHFDTDSGLNYKIDYFSLNLGISVDYYADITSKYNLDDIKEKIRKELEVIFQNEDERISLVIIKPHVKYYLNLNLITEYDNKIDFINDIEKIKNMLVDASTGDKDIKNINDDYESLYNKIDEVLCKLDFENPNPFKSLWEAYNYWHDHLASWAKRRVYFSSMYKELLKLIKGTNDNNVVNIQLDFTNWDIINRTIADIKKHYNEANTVAQFNGIGAMCRNVYGNLADVVYKEEYHTEINSPFPTDNQYKNKLLEFVMFKLDGSTNKDFRSHCKSMIDLADELTHKKTATKQQVALTINALISILNIVSILNENTIIDLEEDDSFEDFDVPF